MNQRGQQDLTYEPQQWALIVAAVGGWDGDPAEDAARVYCEAAREECRENSPVPPHWGDEDAWWEVAEAALANEITARF
jgi:hypothetical protein